MNNYALFYVSGIKLWSTLCGIYALLRYVTLYYYYYNDDEDLEYNGRNR